MTEDAKYVKPGNSNKSIYEIIKSCSLSEKDEIKLKKYIEKKKYLLAPLFFCSS